MVDVRIRDQTLTDPKSSSPRRFKLFAGNAGDSELMSLNATSRIIVSVPADTKIYIVFTKHEENQTGLHKVAGQ